MLSKKSIYLLIITTLFLPVVVFSATFDIGEKVTVDETKIISDDHYVTGGNVILSGTFKEDIIAFAGSISFTGSVGEDALIVGGSVNILGPVGEDLRVFGGEVLINDKVGSDLIAGGGRIQITPQAIISDETVLAGGEVSFYGTSNSNIRIYGEAVDFNGTGKGNVYIESKKKIKISEGVKIEGNLTYKSDEEIEIHKNAVIAGDIIFEGLGKRGNKTGLIAFLGILGISKLLMILVAGFIAIIVFRKFSISVINRGMIHFWTELVRGLVILIVLPIAILLSIISVIGLIPGMIGGLAYLILLILGMVYSGILLGGFIDKYLRKKEADVNIISSLSGIILVQLLLFVPIVGWIIKLVLILISLGSISYLAYDNFFRSRK